MKLTNTVERYGLIAIIFHWLMALLILFLLGVGIYMTRIPMSLFKLKLYGWHKEFGILALILVTLRLLWRLGNRLPVLPAHVPRWQRAAARTVHIIFYFLMFFIPISGLLLSSTAGLPASFFGWFVMLDFITSNATMQLIFTEIHEWLAYFLIFILCLHVGAALKHHFINKDDVLRRMIF